MNADQENLAANQREVRESFLIRVYSIRVYSRNSRLIFLHGDREGGFRPRDRTIHRVALDGLTAGFADEAFEILANHALRSGSAGVVINLFLNHRAVDIVGAE